MRRENEATEKVQATRRDKVENVLKFLLGAAAIVGGSQLLVNAGSDLALWLGVPERVIARNAGGGGYLFAGAGHDPDGHCQKAG